MLLPKFEFHEPSTLDETTRLMAELGRECRPIAGGTDLIVNMKKRTVAPEHVVSLARVADLKASSASESKVRLGACLTAAELSESREVRERLSALGAAAGWLGSPLIRNLATLAGNLVTARPAADLPPPLMAYGAKIVLRRRSGQREVPLDAFFRGPGDTLIEPDEVLTEVVVEDLPPVSGAGYLRLGVRKTLEICLVNAAAFISLDPSRGTIDAARIVLGAVAPTPIRAPSAEAVLIGERPAEGLFEEAGAAASRDSKPIDDFRGSAEYRRDMVKVLTKRALQTALNEAETRRRRR